MAKNNTMPDTPYPISSYDDLITAIQETMDRDDAEFINQIPNFIDFAQKDIFRTKRYNLNAKEAYLAVSNGQANLPTDWLTTDYIVFGNGWKEARETSRQEVFDHYKQGYTLETAPEVVYCRMQERLLFSPSFDASTPVTNADGSISYSDPTIIMGYFFDPNRPSEGGSSPVDYLILVAPDLLMYKACTYAATFIQDSDGETAFTDKTNAIISSLDEQNKQQDYRGPKVVKTPNIRELW